MDFSRKDELWGCGRKRDFRSPLSSLTLCPTWGWFLIPGTGIDGELEVTGAQGPQAE